MRRRYGPGERRDPKDRNRQSTHPVAVRTYNLRDMGGPNPGVEYEPGKDQPWREAKPSVKLNPGEGYSRRRRREMGATNFFRKPSGSKKILLNDPFRAPKPQRFMHRADRHGVPLRSIRAKDCEDCD